MFVVIFETTPNPSEMEQYLSIAGALRPELLKIDGFLENERFRRDDSEGALLSLSLWRDEKSLIRWRTQELHHQSQARGREGVLSDYRLRVGEVATQVDENGLVKTSEPRRDLTEVSKASFVTVSIDVQPGDVESIEESRNHLIDVVQFTSLNDTDRRLLLLSWRNPQFGNQWLQTRIPKGTVKHYGINVIRTYGLHDRLEAPVFHPPVKM
jgi:heme-degrading monooxygenase HmoA